MVKIDKTINIGNIITITSLFGALAAGGYVEVQKIKERLIVIETRLNALTHNWDKMFGDFYFPRDKK